MLFVLPLILSIPVWLISVKVFPRPPTPVVRTPRGPPPVPPLPLLAMTVTLSFLHAFTVILCTLDSRYEDGRATLLAKTYELKDRFDSPLEKVR